MKCCAFISFATILPASTKRVKRIGKVKGCHLELHVYSSHYLVVTFYCSNSILQTEEAGGLRNDQRLTLPENIGKYFSSDKDCASNFLVCDENICLSGVGGACDGTKHCAFDLDCVGEDENPGTCSDLEHFKVATSTGLWLGLWLGLGR